MSEQLLRLDEHNQEFEKWLAAIKMIGGNYELVVEDHYIVRVYVKLPGDYDVKKIRYGRVFGSQNVSYVKQTFLPRIVDGNFKHTVNEEKSKTDRRATD